MRLIAVCLLAMATSVQAGPGPEMVLRAMHGRSLLWSLSFTSCKLTGDGQLSGQEFLVSEPECRQWRKWIAEVKPTASPSSLPVIYDEPQYELVIGQITLPVMFQTPEECELLPGGKMKCETNTLSSVQQLLLALRGRAEKTLRGRAR